MKKKIDGFKQAIQMLQGLDLASQQSLLAEMARKDPEMAIKLKQSLITFDDLEYLTVDMMKRLLKDVPLDVFALALRGANKQTVNHILNMFSTNMKNEIEEILKGKPRPLTEVLEAQNKIMKLVQNLAEKGEIILSKDKSQRYV
jgi:flagellar motor switch protein FliG